jgi:dienelactone hydrolase
MPTRNTLLGVLIVLLSAAGGSAQPKSPDDLPSIKEFPNPFLFNDGTPLKSPADWPKRRAELLELVLTYQYGHVPPVPKNVKGTDLFNVDDARIGATRRMVLLQMGPQNSTVRTHVAFFVPQGQGPFAVIVDGDLSWGVLKDDIVAEAMKRGYAIAQFDRTEFAPDSKDRSTGVYPAYPEETKDTSAVAAWAWGYARVTDWLLTQPQIDPKRIIYTGHSRGGKAAQLAGALDERAALTNPNNSGAGGAGSYRYQADKSEDLARIVKTFPFWFQPRFADFIGKIDKLPIDQHSVKALVAPRAYLSTEALGDLWANPEGTMYSHLAAKEVWKFLGAEDKMAIFYRQGKHEHNPQDFHVLMDFADQVLSSKPADTKFNDLPFPQDKKPFTWTAPK